MAFISPRLVQDIQTTISNAQSGSRVSEAQQQFKQLRKRFDYQLGLANFIAGAKNINDRLLALIELQKMQFVTENLTAEILKKQYYNSVQKEANMIRKLFTQKDNLKWMPIFLDVDYDKMGQGEAIRYIQFIYDTLRNQAKSSMILQTTGNTIEKGLLQLVEVVVESEEGLTMITVLASMFYGAVLQQFGQGLLDRLCQHWSLFSQKCKFYESTQITALSHSITALFTRQNHNFPPVCLSSLISTILKEQNRNNQLYLRYASQYLKFISNKCTIFHSKQSVLSFIEVLNQHTYLQNQNILRESQFKIISSISNKFQDDQQNKQEQLISDLIRNLIEQIFEKYYRDIAQEHSRVQHNKKPLFIYLLPLVNYYNSEKHQLINKWAEDHILIVVNHIGSYLSNIILDCQVKKEIYNEFISCLTFLVKFKTFIQIEMLPHICILLQDIATTHSSISSLCYNFMEQVWQQLAYLDFNEQTSFLLKHLRKINQNQWDQEITHYNCFLHLVEHLQSTYKFCSNFMANDQLFQESIKAQNIMVELLKNNNQKNLQFQSIFKLIILTSYLIGQNKDSLAEKCEKFGVSMLARYVVHFQLEGPEYQKIVKLERQAGNGTINSLLSQKQQYKPKTFGNVSLGNYYP